MHLNEFRGVSRLLTQNVITVNAAKPQKIQTADPWRPIWETEVCYSLALTQEWIREYGMAQKDEPESR